MKITKQDIGFGILTIFAFMCVIVLFMTMISNFYAINANREYVYEHVVVEKIQIRFTGRIQITYFQCNTTMTDDWVSAVNGSDRIFDLSAGDKLTIKWTIKFERGWKPLLIMSDWVDFPF